MERGCEDNWDVGAGAYLGKGNCAVTRKPQLKTPRGLVDALLDLGHSRDRVLRVSSERQQVILEETDLKLCGGGVVSAVAHRAHRIT